MPNFVPWGTSIKRRWIVPFVGVLTILVGLFFRLSSPKDTRARIYRVSRATSAEVVRPTVTGFPMSQTFGEGQTLSSRGTLACLVSCTNRIDKSFRLALEALGASIIAPSPETDFLVEVDRATLTRIRQDGRFAGAKEITPTEKVDPEILALIGVGEKQVQVRVLTLAALDKPMLKAWVAQSGGELLTGCLQGKCSFVCEVPSSLVDECSKRGDVFALEHFKRPSIQNNLAVNPAAMNVRSVWNTHDLTGNGQIVSTSDTGIDTGNLSTMHADLKDRLCGFAVADSSCYSYDASGHGTHTAGSICGTGACSDGTIRGAAYGARLWAWFCCGTDGYIYTPDECDDLFNPGGTTYPAFIHSASWGTSTYGKYTSECSEIDDWVWSHPTFLPVFSAGNEGYDSGNEVTSSVGSPAAAKNVLAVGATQNVRTSPSMGWADGNPTIVAEYSSRGPCRDGRIKPEISTPGTGILSTRSYSASYSYGVDSTGNYAYSCGTSMACPLAAGSAALVREWLISRRGFTNTVPSAALIKAVMTGGAKDVSVPDNRLGWGRLDLEETLYPSNRNVALVDNIPFSNKYVATYDFTLTKDAPLDVQLAWIDYKSSVSRRDQYSKKRLVNDLDLIVSNKTTGAVWYGNGGTSADHINNMESVRIASAQAGEWTVLVRSYAITYDYNEGGAAALYVRGAFQTDEGDAPEEPDTVSFTVSANLPSNLWYETVPAVGTYSYVKGMVVNCSSDYAVSTNKYGDSLARYPLTHWTGTGSLPFSGTNASFEVVLTNNTTLTWHWSPMHDAYALYGYTVLPEEYYPLEWLVSGYLYTYSCNLYAWCMTNCTVSLSLPTDAFQGEQFTSATTYYWDEENDKLVNLGAKTFTYGAVSLCDVENLPYDTNSRELYLEDVVLDGKYRMVKTLSVTMDAPKAIWLSYYDDEATYDGTLPLWWWYRYLYGSFSNGIYDQTLVSATGDPDCDGFTNEMEWGDNTDPVDDQSFRFVIDKFSLDNLTFTASTKGMLVIESCSALGGKWTPLEPASITQSGVTNTVTLPDQVYTASNAFIRVRLVDP